MAHSDCDAATDAEDTTTDQHGPGTLPADAEMVEDRAQRARENAMVVLPIATTDVSATGLYHVTSESGETYLVDLLEGRCGCPDQQHRASLCKHLRRVAMQVTEALLPAPQQDATDYFAWEVPRRIENYEAAHGPDAPEYVAHHLDILRSIHTEWQSGAVPNHPSKSFPPVGR